MRFIPSTRMEQSHEIGMQTRRNQALGGGDVMSSVGWTKKQSAGANNKQEKRWSCREKETVCGTAIKSSDDSINSAVSWWLGYSGTASWIRKISSSTNSITLWISFDTAPPVENPKDVLPVSTLKLRIWSAIKTLKSRWMIWWRNRFIDSRCNNFGFSYNTTFTKLDFW